MNTPIKRCTFCGQEFPATNEHFDVDTHVKCGLRARCKSCQSKYAKQYRQKHGDRVRAGEKRYRDANPDKMHEKYQRQKTTLKETKHKWWIKNRDKALEQHREWRQSNREKIRTNNRNRKAVLKKAQGKHTDEDIRDQHKRQKGRCYWCGKKVGDTYHVDHVIPLDKGGSNGPENLVIACPVCNLSKGSKFPHEWGGSGGRLL